MTIAEITVSNASNASAGVNQVVGPLVTRRATCGDNGVGKLAAAVGVPMASASAVG